MKVHAGAIDPVPESRDAPACLWHPFADMARVPGREFVLDRGEGVWVFDREGRRYLDASGALWYCAVGHGRRELAEIAAAQMQRLAGYQIFDVLANEPALELAKRICELARMQGRSAVFFASGGSDGIDTAAKIARRYWTLLGEPSRRLIIARDGAYHGMHAYGTSLAGIEANATGWGPLVRDVTHVPRDDVGALERAFEQHPGQVAAFVGEPVQGAGGVYPPPRDYWRDVADLCRAHDVVLIADEVVTGFGRLGEWLGSHRYGIEPDMIVTAKSLSSGYMPIGAVVAAERILDVLWAEDAGPFRHGYTYSGHPVACAVALGNLRILDDEGLLQRVRELEPVLGDAFAALQSHPLVEEVRAVGLLAGVEISASARAAQPSIVEKVLLGARERGVLFRNLIGKTLQISPPFVIDPDELMVMASTLRETLDEVEAGLRPAAKSQAETGA
jgi:adenosylmethionine-8-amino-7-oxononanoate aminotransferase